MTEKDEPINDLESLNRKYYTIFNELKNARPALTNCDAAFLSFVQNITEQYESDSKFIKSKFLNAGEEADKSFERVEKFNALNERFYFMGEKLKANKEKMPEGLIELMKAAMEAEYQKLYDLFAGEYDPEMDRKIAEQKALHEIIVPNRNLYRRFLLFFKKKTQNYAADLVDMEASEKAKKVFAEQKVKIDVLAAERLRAEDLAAEFKEKLKAYAEEQLAGKCGEKDERSEQSAESPSENVQSGAEERTEAQPIVNVYVASLVAPVAAVLEEIQVKQLEEGAEEPPEDVPDDDVAGETADASDCADETTEDDPNRDVVIEVEDFGDEYDTEYEIVDEEEEDVQDGADDIAEDAGAPESEEGAEDVNEEEEEENAESNHNQ